MVTNIITHSCLERMLTYGGNNEKALVTFYRTADPSRKEEIKRAFNYLFKKYEDDGMYDTTRALKMLGIPHLPPRQLK